MSHAINEKDTIKKRTSVILIHEDCAKIGTMASLRGFSNMQPGKCPFFLVSCSSVVSYSFIYFPFKLPTIPSELV